MNTLSPFPLQPWEFEGSPHSPLADATCTAHWKSKSVSMRLKVHENLLFFAPRGNNRQLFALSEPLAETVEDAHQWKERPHELTQMFERALAKGMWGRVVAFTRTTAYSKESSCDVALIDSRGGGWVRSLYSDHFERVKRKEFVDDAEYLVHGTTKEVRSVLGRQWKSVFAKSGKQLLSSAVCKRAHIAPTWITGSLGGLRFALETALALFPPEIQKGYLPYPSVYTRSAVQKERLDWHSFRPSRELEELTRLLLRLHVCVGQTMRNDGRFFQPFFVVSPRDVSMHDRMEALLTVRDMSLHTSIEAEVAQFLAGIRI